MTTDQIQQLSREALEQGYLMSLGTVDDGGPWVTDVIYVHDDDLNLYWISDTTVRHSKAIKNDDRVSATITASERVGTEHGLQIAGRAATIDGTHIELALQHWAKRGKPAPVASQILAPNYAWYCLTPTKIELIYQPDFDFAKQLVLDRP
jgi:uncharacterized protein YhbP (UPF0306 family)